MISAKKIGSILWDYFLMTVGCLIFVMGWTSFLLPNEVTSGGLTGLCAVLQYATNDKLQVAYTFPAINAVLIITATFVLGKSFGFRTIYAIAVSSLMFEVMPRFEFLQAVPGNFLYLDEKILIPIIGSVMEGIGIGLILMRGGSTGGTDIAAMIIGRFWPITPGTVYIIHDLAVIGSLLLIPGKTFQDVVYGYISMLTFSFMLDYVILGQKSTVQMLIFSSKYPEIADYIRVVHPLDRAGAYDAADYGDRVIAEVVGSFTNVVGLPMETVREIVGPAGPRGDGPLGERS